MADRGAPRAFVCGHPISHSRSPLIHRYWLGQYGLQGSYDPVDISPSDFPSFVTSLTDNGFAGGNVTIPHKEAAWRAADRRDEAAERIGAVNTFWFDGGKLWGGNTDAAGFAANLDEFAPEWRDGKVAVVLGAGGAARAVTHAICEAGYTKVQIVNRTFNRAAELASVVGARVSPHDWRSANILMRDADLLVNTTALGMGADVASPVEVAPLPDRAIVHDIVYVPLRTPLLEAATARGLKTVDGLGMLLHQAAPGFERWFGVKPAVTPELRRLVIADLEPRR